MTMTMTDIDNDKTTHRLKFEPDLVRALELKIVCRISEL